MLGTNAVQVYGHQAQGVSKIQMDNMNKKIKSITSFARTRACVTTVLAWQFGPTADARVSRPLEQIDAWLHLWTSTTATHRHDTRFTWQRHLTQYLTTGTQLASMGPTAATINAVLRAGWKPSRPDVWQIEKRRQHRH